MYDGREIRIVPHVGVGLADRLTSTGSRAEVSYKVDYFMVEEEGKKIQGVVLATGKSDICTQGRRSAQEIAEASLEERVADIPAAIAEGVKHVASERVSSDALYEGRGELRAAMAGLDLLAESGLYGEEEIESRRREKAEEIAEGVESDFHDDFPTYILLAYDGNEKRMRHFIIDEDDSFEKYLGRAVRGSGYGTAKRELNLYDAGRRLNFRSKDVLIHGSLQAYVRSAFLDKGVGHAPVLTVVDEEGVREVDPKRTAAMTNLVTAQQAGLNPGELTESVVLEGIRDMLGESPKYGKWNSYVRNAADKRLLTHAGFTLTIQPLSTFRTLRTGEIDGKY